MKPRRWLLCLAMMAVLMGTLCGQTKTQHTVPGGYDDLNASYSAVDYFKNQALTTCIQMAYQSEEVHWDALRSGAGYFELGNTSPEALTAARVLAGKFLSRFYASKEEDTSLTLMKCIDFYHSKELESLARKYFPDKAGGPSARRREDQ